MAIKLQLFLAEAMHPLARRDPKKVRVSRSFIVTNANLYFDTDFNCLSLALSLSLKRTLKKTPKAAPKVTLKKTPQSALKATLKKTPKPALKTIQSKLNSLQIIALHREEKEGEKKERAEVEGEREREGESHYLSPSILRFRT
jgi:ABC-type Fe3+/spermidine/putrescine transport system ATPase subunit